MGFHPIRPDRGFRFKDWIEFMVTGNHKDRSLTVVHHHGIRFSVEGRREGAPIVALVLVVRLHAVPSSGLLEICWCAGNSGSGVFTVNRSGFLSILFRIQIELKNAKSKLET